MRLRIAGFFRIVPPSGESQLKPSSTELIAEEDFSLRLPELADLLDRLEEGDRPVRSRLPWQVFPPFFEWISLPSDICRAESKLFVSVESGVRTVSTRSGLSF